MPHDLAFVVAVDRRLRVHGLDVWLAGGWAEELHGLTAPRAHHDVDLLLRDASFAALEEFLAAEAVPEIAQKRFPHKRAFELDGTMVELILVTAGPHHDLTTVFWGRHRYRWPADTFGATGTAQDGPRLVSRTALAHYREVRPPPRPQSWR